MSRKYRVEVGVQALDCMIEILKGEDRNDEEIVGYALDTLANICCPDEFDEEIPVSMLQCALFFLGSETVFHNFTRYLLIFISIGWTRNFRVHQCYCTN